MWSTRKLPYDVPYLHGRFGPPIPDELPWRERIANITTADGKTAVLTWFIPGAPHGQSMYNGSNTAWWDAAASVSWSVSSARVITPTTAINGKATAGFDGATGLNAPVGAATIPTDQCTFVQVLLPDPTQTGTKIPFNSTVANGAGHPNSTISDTAGWRTTIGSTGSSFGTTGDYISNGPRLQIITFSTARGVTMRYNGAQVAADPTRTTALLSDKVNFFSGTTTANRLKCDAGDMLILSVDLSDPVYARGLSVLEEGLMTEYGL